MKRASTGQESYEHVLMCLICRSLFDDHDHQPKFLPCHHTFCKDCLRQYVARLGDEIECPSCRKIATIPAAGVTALQTNFYAKYIQSLVYGCVGSNASWVSDCRSHPGRRLLHFCRDCAASICDLCLQERGCARHRCDLLTAVMERYRCDVDAAFSDANTLIESKKVELERLLKLLAAEKDDALIRIESTFEQHVHALTRRATLLKNKVIDIYNEHAAKVDADLEEVATGLTCIVSLKEHYEPMISHGDFTDAEKGVEELRDVRKNLEERILPRVNRILFEEKHGADGFRNCVKDLGRVVSKPGCELPPVRPSEVEEQSLRCDEESIASCELGAANRKALGVVTEKPKTIELRAAIDDKKPGIVTDKRKTIELGAVLDHEKHGIVTEKRKIIELEAAVDCKNLGSVTGNCKMIQPLFSSTAGQNSATPDCSSANFKTEVSVNIKNNLLCTVEAKKNGQPKKAPEVPPKETQTKKFPIRSDAPDCKFRGSPDPKSTFSVPGQGEACRPTEKAVCSVAKLTGQTDTSKVHTSTVTTGVCTGIGCDSLPQVTLTLNLDNLRALSICSENCSLSSTTSSASGVPTLLSTLSCSSAESDETVSAESELRAAADATRRCMAHKSYDEPRLRLELGYETSDAEDASASPSRQMSRSDFWLMMSSSVESNLSEHDLIVAELSGEQTSL